MKTISGKNFARVIERRGWTLLRVSGSHHIYGRTGSIVRLSIPIHGNTALKAGLLRHLMKLAELNDSDLGRLSITTPTKTPASLPGFCISSMEIPGSRAACADRAPE